MMQQKRWNNRGFPAWSSSLSRFGGGRNGCPFRAHGSPPQPKAKLITVRASFALLGHTLSLRGVFSRKHV